MSATWRNGSSSSADSSPPSAGVSLTAGSLILLLLLLGACGNVLIVASVLRLRRARSNVTNIFIVSLCLNDLLNLLLNQSLVSISYIARAWVLGSWLCRLVPELNMLLVCVSLWHHALIALHRCLCVVHSAACAGRHKAAYCGCVLAGTRLFAVALSAAQPLLTGAGWLQLTEYRRKMLRCIFASAQRLRIVWILVLTHLLPCGVVLLCFGRIFLFVRAAGTRSVAVADRQLLQRELRITKMFCVVFLMFLAGFLPYGSLRAIDTHGGLGANAYVVVTVLYAVASCANPIIFGAMNTGVRLACRQLIVDCCQRH